MIFFDHIGVENADFYQSNIVKENQKQFHADCLRRWIEVKGRKADLKSLVKGLCIGHFHNINVLLKSKGALDVNGIQS